jgi:hypothetical protein
MADGRRKNGGARPNSGPKPKSEHEAVRSLLDGAWSQAERKEAIKKQASRAAQGDRGALSFLMSYCYGRPPQLDELEIQARVESEYDAFILKIKTHLDAPTFQKVIEIIGGD